MKHINVVRFVTDSNARIIDSEARAHLSTCSSCREAVDALIGAERLLAGNSEVLSSPERDAILQRVLTSIAPAPLTVPVPAPASPGARLLAWCRRGWPVLVPAALAASLALWWQRPDEFAVRDAGQLDQPVSALCVAGERVHPATTTTPCRPDDEVVVRLQLPTAAVVHVFGRGLQATGPTRAQHVAAHADVVLDDSWRKDGVDAPRLTVVACADCDRATAARFGSHTADFKVWHIDVPWSAP